MLGRFLEISLQAADIRRSVDFWEQIGFTQCETSDVWPHPYGVVSDGRAVIGLHEYAFPSPALTFVRAGIAQQLGELRDAGIEPAFARTGDEVFNEVGFRDPSGQMVAVLEARTYSPCPRTRDEPSLCGDCIGFSIPSVEPEATGAFWEQLGFVASETRAEPYQHLPLSSDHLDLALHPPSFAADPMLVFCDPSMHDRVTFLAGLGVKFLPTLPRGLDAARSWLAVSPEGLRLLLLQDP